MYGGGGREGERAGREEENGEGGRKRKTLSNIYMLSCKVIKIINLREPKSQ